MVLGSAVGPGMTGFLIDWGFAIVKQYFIFGLYFIFSTLLMYVGIKIYSSDKIVEDCFKISSLYLANRSVFCVFKSVI